MLKKVKKGEFLKEAKGRQKYWRGLIMKGTEDRL